MPVLSEKARDARSIATEALDRLAAHIAPGIPNAVYRYAAFLRHFHRYSLGSEARCYRGRRVQRLEEARALCGRRAGRRAEKASPSSSPRESRRSSGLTPFRCSRSSKRTMPNVIPSWGPQGGPGPAVPFGVGYVFDVSQTDGQPLPASPMMVTSRVRPEDIALTDLVIRRSGIALEHAPIQSAGVYGYSAGGRIRVRPGLDGGMHLRVHQHEWAHEILHNRKAPDTGAIPRVEAIRELEADATTCAVAAVMGYDLGREAWAYLSPRGVTAEQVKEAWPRIHRAVQTITKALQLDRDRAADRGGPEL